jgi:hypothetical protein
MPVEGKDLSSRQTQYVVKNLEIGNLSTSQVFRNCMGRGQNRKGFGWKRWSRRWLYETLGLFNGYRVRRSMPKAAPCKAGRTDRTYRGGAPRAGHASGGLVSSPSPDRRHGRRRHASVTERAAADKRAACHERSGVASDEECAGRPRGPQHGKSSVRRMPGARPG